MARTDEDGLSFSSEDTKLDVVNAMKVSNILINQANWVLMAEHGEGQSGRKLGK